MVVRIPHEATALFEKCRNKKTDSGYLFPILDETTENDKKLYENYRQALRTFNRKLAKMAALLLPGTNISSYTAPTHLGNTSLLLRHSHRYHKQSPGTLVHQGNRNLSETFRK